MGMCLGGHASSVALVAICEQEALTSFLMFTTGLGSTQCQR